VLVPGKPSQLRLVFAIKARAYLSGTPFKDFTLLDLPAKIRPGWKTLPGTTL